MECISSQLIEKKGAIVLPVSLMRFEEANDSVELAVLIQQSRFCGQSVEAGRPNPLGSLSCGYKGEKAGAEGQRQEDGWKKKRGEEPLSFPGVFFFIEMGIDKPGLYPLWSFYLPCVGLP